MFVPEFFSLDTDFALLVGFYQECKVEKGRKEKIQICLFNKIPPFSSFFVFF
jgi:hypothetical protein